MSGGTEKVFKALADPTRRYVLDLLHERSGRTLSDLCERLDMARQSATQHIGLLEEANLITTVRRGREKLHYLNPVPLWEIQDRWIEKFEQPRLRALSQLKRTAEDDAGGFRYVSYIDSTPERVWTALTDAEATALWWGHRNVSDWRPGSEWTHRRTDGTDVVDVVGTVVEATPPHRLVLTAGRPDEDRPKGPSTITFEIRQHGATVRLSVTEENFLDRTEHAEAAEGWAGVLSNLKSTLETGSPLTQAPWSHG